MISRTLSSEYGIHCLELMHFHKATLLLFSELSLITHAHGVLAIASCAKQPSDHTRLENEGSMHCKLANLNLLIARDIDHFYSISLQGSPLSCDHRSYLKTLSGK